VSAPVLLVTISILGLVCLPLAWVWYLAGRYKGDK